MQKVFFMPQFSDGNEFNLFCYLMQFGYLLMNGLKYQSMKAYRELQCPSLLY